MALRPSTEQHHKQLARRTWGEEAAGSGEGAFAGVTGRLDFKDDVENGCFPYRGHLKFP